MTDTTDVPACAVPHCLNQWVIAGTHLPREDCAPRFEPRLRSVDWDKSTLGMGPEAPVVQNGNGASQSEIPAVFTTMPLRALWELAKLQKQGDKKYGAHDWRGIPENDHLDHAFAHLMADRLGDVSDDHLLHATWRLMAALELRLFDERMNGVGND